MSEKKLIGIDTNILVHMLDSADPHKHGRALDTIYTENVADFKQFSDKIQVINPFE